MKCYVMRKMERTLFWRYSARTSHSHSHTWKHTQPKKKNMMPAVGLVDHSKVLNNIVESNYEFHHHHVHASHLEHQRNILGFIFGWNEMKLYGIFKSCHISFIQHIQCSLPGRYTSRHKLWLPIIKPTKMWIGFMPLSVQCTLYIHSTHIKKYSTTHTHIMRIAADRGHTLSEHISHYGYDNIAFKVNFQINATIKLDACA